MRTEGDARTRNASGAWETGIARIKRVKGGVTSAGKMVGVAGFEPATPSSRTRCATRLRYTPTFHLNGCFQRFEACWLRRCPFRWRSYSVLVACPQATSVAFIHCFMIAVACFRKGAQELLFSTSGERAEKQPSALDVMGRGEPRRAQVGWDGVAHGGGAADFCWSCRVMYRGRCEVFLVACSANGESL